MIGIATKNVLSDIPSDTVNLLAWNGGGKSNYTEIIKDGGYDMKASASSSSSIFDKAAELKSELKSIVSELESLIE